MHDIIHDFGVDLKRNHIYLFGEEHYTVGATSENTGEPGVEYTMSNRFIKNMNILMNNNPGMPILIHMKTCGGDWTEGMAIYDTIKSCPSKVIILNYTHARSMSSLIFSAADRRIMMPHSYFMFHLGTYAIHGEAQTVYSNIDFDRKNSDEMQRIYAEVMNEKGKFQGKGVPWIKNWVKKQMGEKGDVFFNAQEAVEYGLADEIFDYNWKGLQK